MASSYMNKKKTMIIIVVSYFAVVLSFVGILFGILYFSFINIQNADVYTMGEDKIPSIKTVIGERKVKNIATTKNIGMTTKIYSFLSESTESDMYEYTKYLVEQSDYVIMKLGQQEEKIAYAKNSLESGSIIVITVDYTPFDFTITLQKGEGTLDKIRRMIQ